MYYRPLPGYRHKLTDFQKAEMQRLHANGVSLRDLSKLYRVPKGRIKGVLLQPKPKEWQHA